MNNQMQQSGGLLLAAEKDGGNSLAAVHSRTAAQTNLAGTFNEIDIWAYTNSSMKGHPKGCPFYFGKGRSDLNNQLQQSGGLLLAAGLDGGNTLVAVHSRATTQANLAGTFNEIDIWVYTNSKMKGHPKGCLFS